LGYAALNVKHPAIIPVFAAFWADTLEVVTELVKSIHDSVECNRIAGAFSAVLQKRLEWLAGRLVKLKSPTPLDIDKILKEFSI
jgi:hypothetical protein